MNRSFGISTNTNISSSRMSAPGTEWEDLRKQARQHENEIDTKLMSFSKLCSNYVARDQSHNGIDSSSTSSSSPSASSVETMSMEIEKLVERLSDINKRMADAVPALLGPNSAATHTLQRHHEILQDYRREFERTKANIRNFKSREDLLMNSGNNPSGPGGPTNSDMSSTGLSSRRQDYYLREMGHLSNSNKMMDTNLELASMLRKDLSDQRRHLSTITSKVNAIANRFPLVNNILQKIKVKKRKDSLVIGFVIALCIVILLLYMFR